MNPAVIISPEAAADLESQLAYLLERDPESATRLQNAVFNSFQVLVASPEIGVSRGFMSARFKNLRMWPVSGFPLLLIYYVPRSSESIEIVRLLHARQDRDGVLGDEGVYWSRDRSRSGASQLNMTAMWASGRGRLVALDPGQPAGKVAVRSGLWEALYLADDVSQAKQLGYEPRSVGPAVMLMLPRE